MRLEIYEEPGDGAYVIGVDSAEGLGRDAGSVHVARVGFDCPHRLVAFSSHDAAPEDTAALAVDLSRRYRGRDRTALVLPEANGPGLAVIRHLLDARVRIGRRDSKPDAPHTDVNAYGYYSSGRSRAVLLSSFRDLLRHGKFIIPAAAVVDELSTFVWRKNRPEAAAGFKDDNVIAAALTAWAAERVPPPEAVEEPPRGAVEAHVRRFIESRRPVTI